jgi:hypothetical protein
MHITRPIQLPSLDLIFKKDEEGHYTKDARLYQDILRYYVERKKEDPNYDGCFKHRELAKWLVNNNHEFKNRYTQDSTKHTSISNRIEHTQERTKDKLKDMVDLGLIQVIGETKVEKGTGTTPLYQYTVDGHLLVWIVESIDPKKRELASDEIYNWFQTMYTQDSSASSVFSLVLFRKFKEKGLFENFVVDSLRRRFHSTAKTKDEIALFQRMGVYYVDDEKKSESYVDLWDETLNEMTPQNKKLILHFIKLDMERKMLDGSKNPENFENLRFELRDRYDEVAVEGVCKKCDSCFSIPLPLQDYLKIAKVLPSEPAITKCLQCHTDGSYVINVLGY